MLTTITKCSDPNLMRHPIVVKLLAEKWKNYGKMHYGCDLVFYLIFLISLNIYAHDMHHDIHNFAHQHNDTAYYHQINSWLDQHQHDFHEDEVMSIQRFQLHSFVVQTVLLIVVCFRMSFETYAFIRTRKTYLEDFMNYIEFFLHTTCMFFIIDQEALKQYLFNGNWWSKNHLFCIWRQDCNTSYFFEIFNLNYQTAYPCNSTEFHFDNFDLGSDPISKCLPKSQSQKAFGALAVLLSWGNLLLFIRESPSMGIYVMMVEHITRTFFKFATVLATFILSFSLSFQVLIPKSEQPFSNIFTGAVSTLVMMIGEMEYAGRFFPADPDNPEPHFKDPFTKFALFSILGLFLIMMSVIVMNLMIGLAVDDTEKIRNSANARRRRMIISTLVSLGNGKLPNFLDTFVRQGNVKIVKFNVARESHNYWREKSQFMPFLYRLIIDDHKLNPELYKIAAANCEWSIMQDKEMKESDTDRKEEDEGNFKQLNEIKSILNENLSFDPTQNSKGTLRKRGGTATFQQQIYKLSRNVEEIMDYLLGRNSQSQGSLAFRHTTLNDSIYTRRTVRSTTGSRIRNEIDSETYRSANTLKTMFKEKSMVGDSDSVFDLPLQEGSIYRPSDQSPLVNRRVSEAAFNQLPKSATTSNNTSIQDLLKEQERTSFENLFYEADINSRPASPTKSVKRFSKTSRSCLKSSDSVLSLAPIPKSILTRSPPKKLTRNLHPENVAQPEPKTQVSGELQSAPIRPNVSFSLDNQTFQRKISKSSSSLGKKSTSLSSFASKIDVDSDILEEDELQIVDGCEDLKSRSGSCGSPISIKTQISTNSEPAILSPILKNRLEDPVQTGYGSVKNLQKSVSTTTVNRRLFPKTRI